MENNDTLHTVVIGTEDIRNVEEFFNHFKIAIPSLLQSEIDNYRTNPGSYTLEMQKKFKSELAHAIVASNHELLQDDIFKNIIKNCDKEWYEEQFNRDLEASLTDED